MATSIADNAEYIMSIPLTSYAVKIKDNKISLIAKPIFEESPKFHRSPRITKNLCSLRELKDYDSCYAVSVQPPAIYSHEY